MGNDLDLLFAADENKVNEFEFKGKKVLITTQSIGWAKKNKIVGQCFTYQPDGQINFDYAKYSNLVLKEIIVSLTIGDSPVPKSEINEIFFARVSSSFGSILEKLIPKAFEENKSIDFLVKEPKV